MMSRGASVAILRREHAAFNGERTEQVDVVHGARVRLRSAASANHGERSP